MNIPLTRVPLSVGIIFTIYIALMGASLYCFGSILFKHYVELHRSNKRKRQGQPE
jgi:hypothetical protein